MISLWIKLAHTLFVLVLVPVYWLEYGRSVGYAGGATGGKRSAEKITLSQVFAGESVGIREVVNHVWLVSFLDFGVGYFDKLEGRVEPGPDPFAEKVLMMSTE